ncbi:MAG: ABC transporter substrate-binding protein [Acidimicrobiales bacterium]
MVRTTVVRRLLAAVAACIVFASACAGDDTDGDTGATEQETTTTTSPEDGDDGSGSEADDEPSYGGRIVIGLEGETGNWLPGTGQFATSGVSVAMSIYDPLMVLTEDGTLEPNLAESLEPNDDLTEWTMTLRDGVVFHDGSALDAEAIKWNFDTLHADPSAVTYGSVESAGIEEVEVVDDLTVVWRLADTNAGFPDVLRTAVGWPVSPSAYEERGAEGLGEHPVGTGPFRFVEWRRDDRFAAERNDDYWRTDPDGNQLPYLDEVEFRPIPDEDSRVQSLAADSVQVISTLRGSSIKAVMNMVDEGGFGGNLFVGNTSGASIFNTLVPPVDDVRIRRALAYAGDAEAVAVVLGDEELVPITTTFFSVDSPWFSETASAAYPGADGRDLETAQELIEEYRSDPDRSDGRAPGDPIEITYSCPPDPSLVEIGQLLQSLWGEAGVEVHLESVEQPTLVSNAVGSADDDPPWSGDYQVNCWRAGATLGDPLTTFQNFFGPPESTPGNFTNFSHPDIDEAIDQLRSEVDFEARYEATEQINLVANEHVPLTWGVGTPTYVGWRGDIRGIADWVTPSGTPGNGTAEGRVIVHQAYLADE